MLTNHDYLVLRADTEINSRPIMPRPAKLPDLTSVDPAELQLTVLTILDQRGAGPEFRRLMHAQLGDCLDAAGGAKAVLQAALAAIRRNG